MESLVEKKKEIIQKRTGILLEKYQFF